MLTEAAGIPVALAVAGANRHDMKLSEATLASVPAAVEAKRWAAHEAGQVQGLCLDKGYDYEEVRAIADAFGYTLHLRARGEEEREREAGKKARRWVVERSTHSWFNRYRRLLVRWEKKSENYLGQLHFAAALITWNRCLFG